MVAPDGCILTVTVDGVETGSALVSTYGTTTLIAPGTYRGDVVIAVAAPNPQVMFGQTFQLRQAVYVDGLSGNVHATIALGVDTKAAYISSRVSSTN